jgi:uncharacterized protein
MVLLFIANYFIYLAVNIYSTTFIANYINMPAIVGRKKETTYLKGLLHSDQPAFVAIYGRRRVGKTFLIREAFDNQFTFQLTGLANADTHIQLTNFYLALRKINTTLAETPPDNWLSAFDQLIGYLEKRKDKKKVVFFDELPWLDRPKSGFLQALEHFWNSWASGRKDMVLIVCGSAASWMIHKLINNKGGLHNRVTKRLKIAPFTLKECEEFLRARNNVLDRYQVIQLYMVMGGIPFYWDAVVNGRSASQNIEDICFSENGLLRTEFSNLYHSLFNKAERHIQIIQALAKRAKGLKRDEIIKYSGLADGGGITRLLLELEESGFLRRYAPFGKKNRDSLYQLSDFYSLFYLRFIKEASVTDKNYWLNSIDSPVHRSWAGYAFEQICLYHVDEIKQALGIAGVQTFASAWRTAATATGAQIDLVIDRRDQVINLCEMKFSLHPFKIDKKYEAELRNKIAAFKSETNTRKSIFLTMITTFGMQENSYSSGLVQNDITMDAFFR